MTKFWKSKLIFIVCLSVSLFLVFSIPALAQVTVSDPQVLDASDFATPGEWQENGFGECFYLLPGPVVPGDEEPVGPDFFSVSPGQYTPNTCFGAGTDVLFPGNIDWRIFRGDPDAAAFAFTAAPTPADDIQEKAKQNPGCLAGGVLNGPRGTTWDDGDLFTGVGIEPPMASELKVNYNGPLKLAYYFVNGEAPVLGGTKFEECRTQDFILSVFPSVGGPVTRTGTVGEFSMGKYVVFELDGLEGETLLRFETAPSNQDLCSGPPPGLGTTCTELNFPDCDYAPAENDVLSGVFLSGCEPPPDCSIGDFVFEDANRDGCQDPDERPIEGVEVTLFTYEDCDENPTGTQVTKTNAAGFYEFTGLDCSKEYRVQFGDAGDIYDYTEFESCLDVPGDPDTNDPVKDSDCNGDDNGFSGCVTFLDPSDPNFAPNDPTIDCGYVCEGKIGDRVWLDDNEDGCQDVPMDEPGIPRVAVTLSEDCEDRENPVTEFTDENGDYEFTGLCPGEYFVEFGGDLPNTLPNQDCDNDPDESDKKDSNCGDDILQCVTLTKDNPEDPTIDCGKIPPPCEVEVTKVAEPDIIVCDSGTDGVDTGTNGTDDPCIVKCEDTGTDGDITDECIAETVTYIITVTNPGGSTVSNIMVDDEVLGFMAGPFTLGPGESQRFPLDGVCIKEDTKNTVVVTVDGELCDEAMAEVMTDFECPETGDGEGCTPGYWKQSQHFDSWTAPYTPDTLFSDVFENAFPGKTLLEVLELGGGGLEALGRHTVAALLNAASSGVSYDLSVNDVIGGFNDVYPGGDYGKLKDIFERFNEQGCPLN